MVYNYPTSRLDKYFFKYNLQEGYEKDLPNNVSIKIKIVYFLIPHIL